jgi:sec-independent protein translocase protein TatC
VEEALLQNTKNQTVKQHLREMLTRLVWVVIMFVAGSVAGYIFHIQIIAFLQHYISGALYYTSPAGSFNFVMKVTLLVGVITAVPALIYQVIKYIQPALKATHRYKRIWLVSLISLTLAITGAAFALFIVIPMSLRFFASFNISNLKPLISADQYLDYVIKALTWFAILFQIPLITLFINRIKPLRPRTLLKYERHVVVAALVIALILPFTYDPLTQFIIAVPIILLYNLSIIFIWFANRKTKVTIKKVSQTVVEKPQIEPVKFLEPKIPKQPLQPRHLHIDGIIVKNAIQN